MKIKIANWNVNSIKARLPVVLEFLNQEKPDIALFQELKCEDTAFPKMEIEDLGYNIATHGQKTYNGVAVLSKFPMDVEQKNLPNFEDIQSRYIEALIFVGKKVLRVASVYVPNGQEVGSDKFVYKLNFFDKLKDHLTNLSSIDEFILIGGDFNVAAENIDVFDVKSLQNTICFHPAEQAKFQSILNSGFIDVFRNIHPNSQQFSWWDYRANAWGFNKGLRIDYILANPKAADILSSSEIASEWRGREKTSDHAPVICEIEI